MISAAKFDDAGNLIVNMERWETITERPQQWRARYQSLANHIRPGSSVIEFGCGGMCLPEVLPEGCSYQPTDIIKRSEDCIRFDIETDDFATINKHFDYAVFAGVLEYVRRVEFILESTTALADVVLFSYATLDKYPHIDIRTNKNGWFNHYTHQDILNLATDTVAIEFLETWKLQHLYRATRRA